MKKNICNYIRSIYLIVFLLSVIGYPVSAQKAKKQQYTVSGTIFDEFGENIPSANIYLKDRPGVGTISDIDGKFTISGSKNDIIIFSYLGYNDFEYVITKNAKDVKITMEPSSIQLEEAVVVGMGKQRKVSVVGAITSVDVKDLQVPATSMNNILGGRVPGVISMQNSGEPGKNISDFWIRGIGTFGASSGALVLIDGLEGNLSQIDPADVESFSILKDASATAVYGVRGANGVVIVTTKRGESQKLRITGRANFTVSYLNKMPEYLDAYNYAKLANEAAIVDYQTPIYTDRELDIIKYGLDNDLYPNVNWQDEILNRASFQQTYYVSAQGGGSIARYFLSLGMSNESAAYKQDHNSKYKSNVGYNTYNYRSNLDINVTKSTTVYLGMDGYISQNNMPGMANTDWLWSSQAKLTPLTVPTRYSNGAYPAYGKNDEISPYILLNHTGKASSSTYRNMVTLAINQDFDFILPGLKLKVQGAFDNYSYFTEQRQKMPDLFNAYGRNQKGELLMVKKVTAYDTQYSSSESQWRKYHFEGNLNYEKLFGTDHRFSALLYYYMSSEGYTGQTSSMAAIPKRYQGLSSRLTYGFKDTYMLDVNFGYTGSENFRKGEQFGFFPAFALGWVPTNYKWVQEHIPFIPYLKVRGSYGTVGNDRISDDRFPYLTIINSNAAGRWGESGIIESVVGADNLAWEKSTKADIGIDGRLFKDERLTFTVDFFRDKRDGIFQRRTQLPDYVGSMQMPYSNVGSMKSYGADGNVAYTQKFGKDWSMTVRGNFTYSNNEVTHWEQPFQKYEYLSHTGKPYNVSRGFIALGLFKDEFEIKNSPKQFGRVRPGDIKYKDVTGDGVITDDDRVPLSYSPMPRLMYGFGGELRYKDFTLGVLFKGTGNTNFFLNNNGYGYVPFYGRELGNVLTIANKQENRWTPAWYSGDPSTENPNAIFPRLSYGKNINNDKYSSYWIRNGKYLRLQELTFNYNLKHKFLTNYLGISSLDLQLIGYNLAVWSKVKLWDPELADSNGYAYPIPMRFAFQLYVNF